jgi:ankyrin repeat protein
MSVNQDEYNYIPPDATPLMDILIRLLDETIDEDKKLKIYQDVTTILKTDNVNATIKMDGQPLDALMIALYAKSKEVVKLLLEHGATVKGYHLQYMVNAGMKDTEIDKLLRSQQGGRRRNQSHRRRKNKKHSRRHHKK